MHRRLIHQICADNSAFHTPNEFLFHSLINLLNKHERSLLPFVPVSSHFINPVLPILFRFIPINKKTYKHIVSFFFFGSMGFFRVGCYFWSSGFSAFKCAVPFFLNLFLLYSFVGLLFLVQFCLLWASFVLGSFLLFFSWVSFLWICWADSCLLFTRKNYWTMVHF